jgi:hypothetical protein
MPTDPITAQLQAELAARAKAGMHKYGISVADSTLTLRAWLQHAKEEALDFAVYLQKLINTLDSHGS